MTLKVLKRHSGPVKQKGGGRPMVHGTLMVQEMVWMKEKAEKILSVEV
jgi:hypothetical protein